MTFKKSSLKNSSMTPFFTHLVRSHASDNTTRNIRGRMNGSSPTSKFGGTVPTVPLSLRPWGMECQRLHFLSFGVDGCMVAISLEIVLQRRDSTSLTSDTVTKQRYILKIILLHGSLASKNGRFKYQNAQVPNVQIPKCCDRQSCWNGVNVGVYLL